MSFRSPVYTVTSASYSLTVDYADDHLLDPASRSVVLTTSSGTSTVVTGYGNGTLHVNGNVTSATSTDWVTLTPGNNKITVSIADAAGHSTPQFIWVTYNAPPSPVAHALPQISTAPQTPDYAVVEQAGSHAAYITPAYVSLDQPRAVAFVYASAMANPRAVVSVDATDNSITPPSRMSIRVKAADGSWVCPETFFVSGAGTTRLTAVMAVSGYSGVPTYTAVVRSYWDATTFTESSAAVRIPYITPGYTTLYDRLGPGWTIAGKQRIRGQSDGSMWLTEGDGTIKLFGAPNTSGIYVSPAGDFTKLFWDGTRSAYVRHYPDGSEVLFSGMGEMTAQVDPYGNATAWSYDSNWALQSITDPAGKVTYFGYDANGYLSTVTDPAGRVSQLQYSGAGDLTVFQDPAGVRSVVAQYNSDHTLAYLYDRANNGWNFGYDANGAVSVVYAPTVKVNGADTNPTAHVRSWLSSLAPQAGLGGSYASASPRVVPQSARASAVDPMGDSTLVALDAWAQPTLVVDPAGRSTTITRDPANGLPTSIAAPSGAHSQMLWDSQTGALTSRDDWAANVNTGSSQYFYTSACPAQPYKVASTYGATWFTLGSKCEVKAARTDSVGGNPTLYTYDSRYRVVTATDSVKQIVTRFARDHNTWLNTDTVTVTSPSNPAQSTRIAYDAYGRTSAAVNPNGEAASVAYDVLNRVTSTTDAALHVTRTYWGAVSADSIVDAAGKRYSWTRNALGWVTREVQPAGVRKYGYDEKGRVTSTTTRDTTKVISLAYDNLDRVTSRTTPDVGTTTYTFDPAGLWQVAANPESRDSVVSDEAGRVTSVTSIMGGSTYTQRYWYRPDMQLDSAAITAAGTTYTQRFLYTSESRLRSIGSFGGATPATIAYDSAVRPKAVTYPGGVIQSLAYNSRGQLYTSTYTKGYNTLWSLGGLYGYDALNRINQRFSIARDTSRSYGYDSVGQLTGYDDYNYWTEQVCTGSEASEVCTNQPRSANYNSRTFTYDAVGNRTDGATLQPNSNRYATFNGYALAYDPEGNLTSKTPTGGTAQTFYWNSLGQLDSVKTGWNVTRYGYNGLGMRVRTTNPASVVTRSLYDGMGNLTAELGSTGTPLRLYSYYPSVDEPFSMYDVASGTSYYYDTEAPGHVKALFNANGTAVNTYRYTPFGEMEPGSPQEAVTNSLKYMSRELDANTGLYYVRARWYDPVLGRFVSEDPIGLDGGINNYAYAGNDPVNFTDPTGLDRACVVETTTWQVTVRRGGRIVNRYTYQTREELYCSDDLDRLQQEYERERREARSYLKHPEDMPHRTLQVCDAIVQKRAVQMAGDQVYVLAVNSGIDVHRTEFGQFLSPSPSGTYLFGNPFAGEGDMLLGDPAREGGSRILVHGHIYRAPVSTEQSLSPGDVKWAEDHNGIIVSFSPDSVSWYRPGGQVRTCPRH